MLKGLFICWLCYLTTCQAEVYVWLLIDNEFGWSLIENSIFFVFLQNQFKPFQIVYRLVPEEKKNEKINLLSLTETLFLT